MDDQNNLNQAQKRDKKVFITDIAIEKVPYVEYKGLDEKQNEIMQRFVKMVLAFSKENNDSNEVAITWNLLEGNPDLYGISYGAQNYVDVEADTYSYHLLHSEGEVIIVLFHNHPSTRTFSLDDINFLLYYRSIEYMVVVSNQGTVHYLKKEKTYSVKNAKILYNECVKKNREAVTVENKYAAALDFLKRCSEVGLFYQ